MLDGTNVCVNKVGVPGGNPPAWLGDHMTISHAPLGIETRLQQWEASALTLRQLDKMLLSWPVYSAPPITHLPPTLSSNFGLQELFV